MVYRDLAQAVNERPSPAAFASEFRNRIELERGAAKHRISYLLVEGPDDMSAMQKFARRSCRVDWAGSKEHVVRALKTAASGMDGRMQPFNGIAGLVDRDLEHLAGEQLRSPRVCSYECCNDLESAVLYFRWQDVLDSFVKRHLLDKHLAWITLDRERSLVAREVCAPVGLIRALHQSENRTYKIGQNHNSDKRIDDFSRLAEPILQSLFSADTQAESRILPETLDTLTNLYLGQFGKAFRIDPFQFTKKVRAYETRLEARPWDFVRGKDMVDSLAYIINSLPNRCRIYPSDPIPRIKERLSAAVIQLVDLPLLEETGIQAQFARIENLDGNEYEYFERLSD